MELPQGSEPQRIPKIEDTADLLEPPPAPSGISGAVVGGPPSISSELEFWRVEFERRPYGAGRHFDELEPVFRSAVDIYDRYGPTRSRSFEDIESWLRQRWINERGTSALGWDDVREASRDAWNRIAKKDGKSAAQSGDEQTTKAINDLLKLLRDSVEGLRAAAERLTNTTHCDELRRVATDRQRFIDELTPIVVLRGGRATEGGSISGAIHRAWLNLRTALGAGDEAIIAECERGEDAVVGEYRKLLEEAALAPQFREALGHQYIAVRAAHGMIGAWKHAGAEAR